MQLQAILYEEGLCYMDGKGRKSVYFVWPHNSHQVTTDFEQTHEGYHTLT